SCSCSREQAGESPRASLEGFRRSGLSVLAAAALRVQAQETQARPQHPDSEQQDQQLARTREREVAVCRKRPRRLSRRARLTRACATDELRRLLRRRRPAADALAEDLLCACRRSCVPRGRRWVLLAAVLPGRAAMVLLAGLTLRARRLFRRVRAARVRRI